MLQNASRRTFLRQTGTVATGALFPFWSWRREAPPLSAEATVQEVIDLVIGACGAPIADTVDTVKSGDPSRPCTGIATTFLATAEVIKRAVARGVNLIITHEPLS